LRHPDRAVSSEIRGDCGEVFASFVALWLSVSPSNRQLEGQRRLKLESSIERFHWIVFGMPSTERRFVGDAQTSVKTLILFRMGV
jgi:hypothetical protein